MLFHAPGIVGSEGWSIQGHLTQSLGGFLDVSSRSPGILNGHAPGGVEHHDHGTLGFLAGLDLGVRFHQHQDQEEQSRRLEHHHGDAAVTSDQLFSTIEEDRKGDGGQNEEKSKQGTAPEGEFPLVDLLRRIESQQFLKHGVRR